MKIIDRKVSFNNEGIIPDGISSPEEMLLFDIETTGLKKEYSRVYLTGCAYMDIDGWHIRQWLTQKADDEADVLLAFADFARGFKTLLSFNGEGFDIPFIDYRCRLFGIESAINSLESFDIYKKIKPLKKILGAKSLSQKSVESMLGIKRLDKLDGGLLIPYYYEYEKTHSPENEKLILLHNFEDVLGMGKILPVLNYLGIIRGEFEFEEYFYKKDALSLKFVLKYTLPAPFKNEKISGLENMLFIDFDIKDGRVFIPLKDYKNYYYLPAEDMVIHKDLACFVDKKYRQKANKENCFLKADAGTISAMNRDDLKSFAMDIIDIYK